MVKCTECSRNLEFEKRTDQTLSHKFSITEGIFYLEEKETVKTMLKGSFI